MSVTQLFRVVEGSQDPCAIPPRPAPDPAALQFHQMPDRLWTYRVTAGAAGAVRTIGYVRHDPDDVWIARTTGSDMAAASIRKFANQGKAGAWLASRVHR